MNVDTGGHPAEDGPADDAGRGPEGRQARWRLLHRTVQGPHKVRNQDWANGWPDSLVEEGRPEQLLVFAAADGHGSPAHLRSHLGARYAVDVFLRIAQDFAHRAAQGHPLARLKAEAQQRIPEEIVRAWEDECARHLRKDPLDEFPLGQGERPQQRHLVPYGTTLIGAVITPELVVGWQQGDGDFTVVDADGRTSLPLAPRQLELGDETDSLCSRHAARLMRVHWVPVVGRGRMPGMVMLSTDGLSKGFVDQSGFREFGSGMYQRLEQQGPSRVLEDLGGWLERAATYSGDDTTVIAAWHDRGGWERASTENDSVYRPDESNDRPDESNEECR